MNYFNMLGLNTKSAWHLQANARARFDETIEIAINLGTNPKRGDQAVRGTAVLPFGTGKSLRVAAFAEGEDAVAATAAGKRACLCLCTWPHRLRCLWYFKTHQ